MKITNELIDGINELDSGRVDSVLRRLNPHDTMTTPIFFDEIGGNAYTIDLSVEPYAESYFIAYIPIPIELDITAPSTSDIHSAITAFKLDPTRNRRNTSYNLGGELINLILDDDARLLLQFDNHVKAVRYDGEIMGNPLFKLINYELSREDFEYMDNDRNY